MFTDSFTYIFNILFYLVLPIFMVVCGCVSYRDIKNIIVNDEESDQQQTRKNDVEK